MYFFTIVRKYFCLVIQGHITFNDNGTRPENIILLQQYRIPAAGKIIFLNSDVFMLLYQPIVTKI